MLGRAADIENDRRGSISGRGLQIGDLFAWSLFHRNGFSKNLVCERPAFDPIESNPNKLTNRPVSSC